MAGITGADTPSGTGGPSTVDLMLPADCPVAVLIPPIVDRVLDKLESSATATDPQRWCLTRIGGELIDGSMTLQENAIHDGELIRLTTSTLPLPRPRPGDSSGVVAEVAQRTPLATLQAAVTAAGLAVTVVSAAALAWTGGTSGISIHLWTAAALSALSAISAVATTRPAHRLSAALALAAVLFAVVTGFLAGPNAPWAPAFLLSASSGFAVSILLLHMTDGNTALLTALAAVTGVIATVGAIGLSTRLAFGTAGALLTVLSLAALSAAPKLTVAALGLGPSRLEIGNRRAAVAHRVLTGLVAGWSCSATLGVMAIAAVTVAQSVPAVSIPAQSIPAQSVPVESIPTAIAAMFAADVGLLLLLRQRTHIDVRRRVGLGVAGLCALTAAHIVTVSAAPEQAFWLCAATFVAGVAAVACAARTTPPNPVVRQGLQVLEYLTLAAVVPLAAWVAGVYGMVRDLSLP